MRFTPESIDLDPVDIRTYSDPEPVNLFGRPKIEGTIYVGLGITGDCAAALTNAEREELLDLVRRIALRVESEAAVHIAATT